ncbi:MAG: SDR family oxidoreductase [Balneolaceae bacterium]|nr:SDR family oxidoreductase [Balneolaceae bacterium]MCH8548895.1 SDR family oxidoreductase [Balneolaceae bacterium]
MKKILIAGATGTLGRELVRELHERGYPLRILVRKEEQAGQFRIFTDDIRLGQVTQRETLRGVAEGVDAVFSAVGITRQKDGITYQDVDYGGNSNLLKESISAGAAHFVYIASLNGEEMRELKMIEAKERFVDELKSSPIRHTIVRPNGFFSDLLELLKMARNGRIYLPGNGSYKVNPISTKDLALVVADMFEGKVDEEGVGGPQILSQKEIAEMAFRVLGKPAKITYLPEALVTAATKVMRLFTPISVYGPLEFFFTVSTRDMITEQYGDETLEEFYLNAVREMSSNEDDLMNEPQKV